MKFLIICALIAIAAAEWKPKSWDEMKEIRLHCMDETKMSEEMKLKIKNFEYPKEEKVMKYLRCTLKKSELFDDEKGMDKERFSKMWGEIADHDDLKEAADKCFDKNDEKTSAEEWAWRCTKCIFNSKVRKAIKDQIKW